MLDVIIQEAKTFIAATDSPTRRRRHRQRFKVFFYLAGRCWYCGLQMYIPQLLSTRMWFDQQVLKTGKVPPYFKFTIDHVHSIKRGGKINSLKNFLPSCNCCNSRKGESSIEEFRTYVRNIFDNPHRPGIKDLPFTRKFPRLWKLVNGDLKFYGELVSLGIYSKDFQGPNPFLN